ncbi:MAG: NYN domain-containing protein, partial [Eubacteriales bacterium]
MDKLKNIAVLIDAENAQPSTIKEFLKKISSYGYIGVKQAFADWSKPTAKNWDAQCKALSINRVMQGSEVKGKNAVDIALVVEAMDLLNKNHFDGF